MEWNDYALSELVQIFDGPHATPTKTETGPYFLSISSLKDGRLDLSESAHLSEEEFMKWTRRVTPEPGDLLFSYETRLGQAALMTSGIRACLGRRMGLLRPDRSKVNPKFLLFSYLSPGFQETIRSRTIHGATVDRIPLKEMGTWPIKIPSLSEQESICGVLGSLDDKIAVNNRVIAALWGLLGAYHDQSLQGSVRSVQLSEIMELRYGKSLPAARRRAGEIPVIGSGGVSGFHDENLIQGPGVVIGRKGSVGTVYWVSSDFFPIDTTFYVHLKDEHIPLEFAYQALRKLGLGNMSSDSAVPGLNRESALARSIEIPSVQAIGNFMSKAVWFNKLVDSLGSENASLMELRDTLLPRLMSGEIRVKDAERIVEDVT